jgi:hypothetical protein
VESKPWGQNPVFQASCPYSLLKLLYFSPDRNLLRESSWLCPSLPILTVLKCYLVPFAPPSFTFSSTPSPSPRVLMFFCQGLQVQHTGPRSQGLCRKVLLENPGKYVASTLSWESGSLQDKLSVKSQD